MAIRKNIVEKFDHFCDYTSIVGFRLLRSENPRWLRISAVGFFITFIVMFTIQTKDAFLRFIDPSKVPIPTFNLWVHKNITRPSIVICSTNRDIKLAINNTDEDVFELLVYELAKPENIDLDYATTETFNLTETTDNEKEKDEYYYKLEDEDGLNSMSTTTQAGIQMEISKAANISSIIIHTQLDKEAPVYEYIQHPSFGRCILLKTEEEYVYSRDDIESSHDIQDFYLLRNNDYNIDSANEDESIFAGFMYNSQFGFLNRIGMSPGNFLQIHVDGFTETINQVKDEITKKMELYEYRTDFQNRQLSMEILDAFEEGEFDDYTALVGNEEKNDTLSEKRRDVMWDSERTVEEDEFALHNSFAINIVYRNYITQEILYSDDFSFWSLLTEVGGALGLYFGVTVITLYETFFFFFTVKEVKPIRETALDKKLTKRILYFKEANAEDNAQLPVPLHL